MQDGQPPRGSGDEPTRAPSGHRSENPSLDPAELSTRGPGDLPTRSLEAEGPGSADVAPLPERIGRYRILSKLGEGGMGVVFEAEQLFLEALEAARRVLGADHNQTLNTMLSLAGLYEDQGRYEEAEPHIVEALAGYRRVLGDSHNTTLECMGRVASLYEEMGRYAEAELLLVESLEGLERVRGAEHKDTLNHLDNLGSVLVYQGRYEEAGTLLQAAFDARVRTMGEDHEHVRHSHYNFACLATAQGKRDEALEHLRKAVSLGWNDPWILTDTRLDPLRGQAEFETMVETVRKRLAD